MAVWTPLPPQRSGIADYSYELLEVLARILDIVVVVEDAVVSSCKPPTGAPVIGASRHRGEEFSTNVFQMGNNLAFHGYMVGAVLRLGGVLVLHDLSFYDLFWADGCNGLRCSCVR